MRRICFYNHTAELGGAETVLCNMLRHLDLEVFHLSVISPVGDLASACSRLGIEHIPTGELRARFSSNPFALMRSVLSGVRNVFRFRRLVTRQKPDILYANTVRAGLVATLATIGMSLKVVWHIHDILPSHPVTTAICYIARTSERTSFIAVSEATAERFRQAGCSSKMTVIPNGIDPNLFYPDPQSGSEIRRSLGLSASDFVVGMLGQIAPRKGQLGVVAAFSEFSRVAPTAALLIVGEPMFTQGNHEYHKQVMSVAAEAPRARIQFLGRRRDMRSVINAVDVVIMNSSSEPFALVVVESMACGKPVMAPARDGFLEIIENGVNGYLFSSGGKAAILEVLTRCYFDRKGCQDMGCSSERLIRRDFTCDKQSSRISQYLLGIDISEREPVLLGFTDCP